MGIAVNKTKLAIAEAFAAQVERVGMDKVRVLDVVYETHLNKNSFYYHFASRDSVARWLVRYDIAAMIEEEFAGKADIAAVPEYDEFPEFPYYARLSIGVRMIDQGAFLRALVVALRRRRLFYKETFRCGSADALLEYLEDLYRPMFQHDVEIVAAGRYLSREVKDFLVTYSLKGFIGMIDALVCAAEVPAGVLDDARNPFWNIGIESLSQAIRVHPLNVSVLEQISLLP